MQRLEFVSSLGHREAPLVVDPPIVLHKPPDAVAVCAQGGLRTGIAVWLKAALVACVVPLSKHGVVVPLLSLALEFTHVPHGKEQTLTAPGTLALERGCFSLSPRFCLPNPTGGEVRLFSVNLLPGQGGVFGVCNGHVQPCLLPGLDFT